MIFRITASARIFTGCLALSAFAISARADDPGDFYRAYWASDLDFADLEALGGYYSEAALGEIREIKEEMGEEAFKEMAADRNAFVKGSTITALEAKTEGDKSALELRIDPGEEGRKHGVDSLNGEVDLTRSPAGWRIEREDFFSEAPAQPVGDQGDCPPGYALGDPDAPNSILFRQADGDRSVHFGEAWLILDSSGFTIEIPGFKHHEWNLTPLDDMRTRSPRAAAEQKIQIAGRRALEGCLAIPQEMQSEDVRVVPQGMIVFKGELPFQGTESFAASFEFKTDDAPGVAIIGEITAGRVLDIRPKELVEKGVVLESQSGGMRDIDSAVASHYPHLNRLTLDYQYRSGRGTGSGNFHVMDFDGNPGVLTRNSRSMEDGDWIDMIDITIIDAFGENEVAIETREIRASELPDGDLTVEAARGVGSIKMKMRCDHVVVRPERERIR